VAVAEPLTPPRTEG